MRRATTELNSPNRFRPWVEALEDRTNPTTFFPTTTEQLASAIATANANSQDDVIDLGNKTFTLTEQLASIAADGGHALTIQNGTLHRDSGANNFRILTVASGAELLLSKVTLQGGKVSDFGAGLYNAGTVTIKDSVITGNNAGTGEGGGIYNASTGNIVLITNSTISNNDAAVGGGIANQGTIAALTSSTISNNDALHGGGLANAGTVSLIANATFSSNTATFGGGLQNSGTITVLANSTIARGTSGRHGGGIDNTGTITTLTSTIIADNTSAELGPDLRNIGTIATAKDNLIESTVGHDIANGINGNIVGKDPKLGALANNGGLTLTHALLDGSLAINAGNNDQNLSTDQRGYDTRSVSGDTDIGAWEKDALPPVVPDDDPTVDLLAVGIDPGVAGDVDPRFKVYNADGSLRFDLRAYENQFRGGVRVATGDINNDGIEDIITGAGVGGGPRVRVFDGLTGNPLPGLLGSFFAFDSTGRTGIYVAAGDINNDGHDDVIVSQESGGTLEVRVFSGVDGNLLSSFYAGSSGYSGGLRIAAGNVTGDARDEILVVPGAGSAAQVRVFEGVSGNLLEVVQAFETSYTGGAYLATGDLNGDGLEEILVSTGALGKGQVSIFDLAEKKQIGTFNALTSSGTTPTQQDGIRVATLDVDGDGRDEIVTGQTSSLSSKVRIFKATDYSELDVFFAFDPPTNALSQGDFVG